MLWREKGMVQKRAILGGISEIGKTGCYGVMKHWN
jgi:hypothetical protein